MQQVQALAGHRRIIHLSTSISLICSLVVLLDLLLINSVINLFVNQSKIHLTSFGNVWQSIICHFSLYSTGQFQPYLGNQYPRGTILPNPFFSVIFWTLARYHKYDTFKLEKTALICSAIIAARQRLFSKIFHQQCDEKRENEKSSAVFEKTMVKTREGVKQQNSW